MKKPTKIAANPCPAAVSGGTFKCALERDHKGAHSTSANRKPGQHATWLVDADGRIAVTTYSHGKRMADWYEASPIADAEVVAVMEAEQETEQRCGASQNNVWHEPTQCRLVAGHDGDHEAEVVVVEGWPETGETRRIAWDKHGKGTGNDILGAARPRAMTLHDEPEDPEADAAALAAMDAEAATRANLDPVDDDDPLEDEIRSDDERDFARKMREDREAHAAEIEDEGDDDDARWYCGLLFIGTDGRERKCEARNEHAGPHYAWCKVAGATIHAAETAKEPSLTDACTKCGREIGEHDGAKCPKPYGFILRSRGEVLCEDESLQGGAFRESDLVGAAGYKPKVFKTKAAASNKALHLHRVTEIVPWYGALERSPAPIAKPAPEAALDLDAFAEPPAKKISKIFTKAEREQFEAKERARAVTPEGAHERSLLKVHPAADALPLIEGAEFQALVDDIRANGLRHRPVLDHSGLWLVDGRNRMRACQQLGIAVEYDRLPEGTNIAAFVISTNLKRRHLTESQRAIIAAEIANLAQGRPSKSGPGAGLSGVTQAEAAAGAGVGERTVRRANAVRDKAVPELVAAVKAGKVDLKGAEQVAKLSPAKQREIVKERVEPSKGLVRGGKLAAVARQEEKRAIVRKINEQRVAPMPGGAFGVIYADYPWLYENSDQHEGSHGHLPYPGMTLERVVAHAREAAKRAAQDCVIALWVTNLYIPKIGHVIEAFGAEHRTMWTWPKPRIGVGGWARGQTEHLVIASIGEPVHTMNEISTLLPSFRPSVDREHSSKPDEVAALLAQHCTGPFLELFARAPREGWITWGAEVDKFATEAG